MELTNNNRDKKARRQPAALTDLGNIMYGKVPPQAKELEEAVLGAILIEKAAFDKAIEAVTADSFYVDAHQRIFKAIQSLAAKNMPIDLLTVVEELKNREELDLVGGPYFVTKLTNSVVSSANIEAHCRIVQQKYMARLLIQVSGEICQMAYDDSTDVFDCIDLAERRIMAVNSAVKTTFKHISKGLVPVFKRIEDLRHSNEELTGVNTGFKAINELTCGWQKPDLIILAARPSVGKTAFALNLALAAANSNVGVGFFTMEMSEAQLIQRLLSIESQMGLKPIIRGKLTDDDMKDLYKLGAQPLEQKEIYIDDTPGINIYELRNKVRKMHQQGVRLVIIDYLQLMNGVSNNSRNDNREQEISKISRDLKGLAKELDMPIIALSQLSREVEKRQGGNKMPQLSDLRESGAIEQDADIVMFMYRPEYYGKHSDENGKNLAGETHIKFAKHRSGALEIIKLKSNLAIQRFYDYEDVEQLGLGQGGGNPWDKLKVEKGMKMHNPDNGTDAEDFPF